MFTYSKNVKMAEKIVNKCKDIKAEQTNSHYTLCIDFAEKIIRDIVTNGHFKSDGLIADNNPLPDPKRRLVYYGHATARFTGALGCLVEAGRCVDLADRLVTSYELLISLLNKDPVKFSSDFWVKEMLFAHRAIKKRQIVSKAKIKQWENIWNNHNAPSCYACELKNHQYNGWVFAATAEMLKINMGLKGSLKTVDKGISILLQHFTKDGLYCEIHKPLTYDLVVRQQLDYILLLGYNGKYKNLLEDILEKSGYITLLYQSSVFQTPFGGRSNQFIFTEGHMAAYFESRARFFYNKGDYKLAGVFKRAAKLAISSVKFWVNLKPYRHIRNCFDPSLGHGVDSGGFYTVYGTLAASLFMITAKIALKTKNITERKIPAESSCYAFKIDEFHKIFAACLGYHIEIDTKADFSKEATGFSRLHKTGVMPETALSLSITSTPSYTFNLPKIEKPKTNLAIGPVNMGKNKISLANISKDINNVKLTNCKKTNAGISFNVKYDIKNFNTLIEQYKIDKTGVTYQVSPACDNAKLSIPLIKTNGLNTSKIKVEPDCFEVKFAKSTYTVKAYNVKDMTIDYTPYANRNAVYYRGIITFNKGCPAKIKLTLQ